MSDCCCDGKCEPTASGPWIVGTVSSPAGDIPRLATEWDRADVLGAVGVRLGIRRDRYRVDPGLYAVGGPNEDSPVLVTANYKLTLDVLRRELSTVDAWILVLDTQGVNVWCAAGKGTFGTEELVKRIEDVGLGRVVKHRRLVLPQLGAPGVAAHVVARESGFKVVYGPVRAADIPSFLTAGMKASAEMRRVQFTMLDRLVVVPVEVAIWGKYAVGLAAAMLLARWLCLRSWEAVNVWRTLGLVALAFFGGTVGVPVMLPWLPGRAFAVKGAALAVILGAIAVRFDWLPGPSPHVLLDSLAWLAILVSVVSFTGMNFTGTSTYTSQSGVKREMRLAVPLQLLLLLGGIGMWVAAAFV